MSTHDSTEIAFASDTQAPMWVETILLKYNRNRTATRMLFADVARRKPQALFILGDVVNLGYSNIQWKPMDKYLHHLRDTGVQVHAILGNHEVMGRPRKGQRKFQQRFPDHVATGYVKVVDSVAVVLLNSNFNTLTREDNDLQQQWYEQTLQELDADPRVQFTIVSCHHSPFTNSKIVGANKTVQERFVPGYIKAKKARLFLSGHSHNYEHFRRSGKDFLVIGGGGGLHQPLRPGAEEMSDEAQDYKPMFHYITVRREDGHLVVNSHQLEGDFSTFGNGRSLAIKKESEQVLDVAPARVVVR
ncbi:MAG: metallophosphoesterase [Chitinophagaceae bacterium]|nr:MAG: metallophosphoesterase [Chitinophagaceae bacterium]